MYRSLLFLVSCLPLIVSGQTAVGTSSPNASAKFEVYSTNQGFLGPRVALTGNTDVTTIKNASGTTVTPATGLMVYNTATAGSGSTAVTPGYYAYSGSSWVRMSASPSVEVNGTNIANFPNFTMGGIMAPSATWAYTPLAEISLPPGKWEITGEFHCVLNNLGFGANVTYVDGWYTPVIQPMHTYWISDGSTNDGWGHNYPIALSGFTYGAPTNDKTFTGSNVTILPLSKTQHLQQMKFYITNSGATNKTYYLHWHQSYYNIAFNYDDETPSYVVPPTGSNRFFAVKIQ